MINASVRELPRALKRIKATFPQVKQSFPSSETDLVTVFDTILTSRQTRDKLQCLYENLMSNNFRKTAVLKKI